LEFLRPFLFEQLSSLLSDVRGFLLFAFVSIVSAFLLLPIDEPGFTDLANLAAS
jgi:hypothetical protein